MSDPTCVPFKPETWPLDADGFAANLCTDCGTPVRYGSRHGHCLEPAAAPTRTLGPDEFIGKAKINGHWYRGRHMIRVAQITYDGSTCTVPLSALVDMLGDGETYQVRVTSMRKAEFDRLEEFAGW